MTATTGTGSTTSVATHDIDSAFVESHGRQVMDVIRPTDGHVIGRVTPVIGTDLAHARRVASQLRAGRLVINNLSDDPQAPWGGFKFSGIGREYGRYGIEAFLETRAILES